MGRVEVREQMVEGRRRKEEGRGKRASERVSEWVEREGGKQQTVVEGSRAAEKDEKHLKSQALFQIDVESLVVFAGPQAVNAIVRAHDRQDA